MAFLHLYLQFTPKCPKGWLKERVFRFLSYDGVMTSYWFYKMAAIESQIYFRFSVWPCVTFTKVYSYLHTNFRPDVLIHGWHIPVSEHKWLPYWNSTFSFDFDLSTVISMWFCIGIQNDVSWELAHLWQSCDVIASATLDLA